MRIHSFLHSIRVHSVSCSHEVREILADVNGRMLYLTLQKSRNEGGREGEEGDLLTGGNARTGRWNGGIWMLIWSQEGYRLVQGGASPADWELQKGRIDDGRVS